MSYHMTKLKNQLINSTSVRSYAYDVLSEQSTLISEDDIEAFAQKTVHDVWDNGPKMYKVYTIPKRSGGRRTIAHPSKPLKAVQKALVELWEAKLPIHSAALAYQKGKSIKENAECHRYNKFLLKVDLSEFFNSIDIEVFESQLLGNNIKFDKRDSRLIRNILFWSPQKSLSSKLVLSVGAPSSPFISNFVMYIFDSLISEACESLQIIYTRYADDMFFSTQVKNTLFKVPEIISFLLKNKYGNKLLINESKTIFSSKAHNRHVTGITITNDNKLSLGRSRKRYISSMVHKYKLGMLDFEDIEQLQGLLGFAKNIEPEFLVRLKKKYSSETVKIILNGKWKNEK